MAAFLLCDAAHAAAIFGHWAFARAVVVSVGALLVPLNHLRRFLLSIVVLLRLPIWMLLVRGSHCASLFVVQYMS